MSLSFLHCSLPVWSDGRVSPCVQRNYLSILVPLAACSISLLLLLLSRDWRRCLPRNAGTPTTEADAFEPLASENRRTSTAIPPRYINTHGPRLTLLERLTLLADVVLGICLVLYASQSDPTRPCLTPFCSLFFSGYLLCLLVGRGWNRPGNPDTFTRLWTHSMVLYQTQWLCTLVLAHAAVMQQLGGVGPGAIYWRCAILVRFGFFTVLFLLQLTAPKIPADPCHMDDTYAFLRPAQEQKASILSRLTFFWVNELVWKAYRTPLESSDLYDLNRDQKSTVVTPAFRVSAADSLPLLRRLYYFFISDLLMQGVWAAIMSVTMFVPAMLLRLILLYLESPDMMARATAWLCVGALLVSGLLTGIAECQSEWIGRKISAKLRAILVSEIYAKVLRRKMAGPPNTEAQHDAEDSDEAGTHASDGNINNLMAVDAEKISEIGAYLHLAWISFPMQILIATSVLYTILGLSGVAGVMLMIALLPLNILLTKRQVAAQEQVLAAADARVQSSNELVTNIHIIKYCAWEGGIKDRVLKLRRAELGKLRSRFIWWSLSTTVWYSIPLIITILTLLLYTIVAKNTLEASVAFPAIAVFAVLRMPFDRVADVISFILQAHVSMIRVDKFLVERETGKYVQLSRDEDSRVGFNDASFEWPSSEIGTATTLGDVQTADISSCPPFQLRNLQISFYRDGLNVVCGASGSGKSSLLLALLGEMELLHGRVLLPHEETIDGAKPLYSASTGLSRTTAYCPQEPWILNQTIRKNILFGSPFDSGRYDAVLNAVALSQDLAELDKNDQTMAGEKGSRLSGGQKQRVALARALYSRSQYVLLDDCLSAVDSRTAKHIFFHAIKGPLMSGRTCILATHHIKLAIQHCDYAVLLEKGQVKGQGTAKELASAGLVDKDGVDGVTEVPRTNSGDSKLSGLVEDHFSSAEVFLEGSLCLDDDGSADADRDYEEDKLTGAVGWPVTKSYLTSMGAIFFWIVVLAAFAAQQLASLGTNLWIKEWAHQYDNLAKKFAITPQSITTPSKVNAVYYLAVYTMICLLFVLISFFRDALTFYGALKASSRIYERLLDSILHAKLVFFDRVPLGQITNRFSKDIEVLDQELAPYAISTFHILASLAVVIIIISTVLPAFLLVAVIICLAYYSIAAVYINSSRDLKRIESVERSPLYQQLGETLSGYNSIRAYNRVSSFTAQSHNLIDRYNRPHIQLWASKEWLTLRIGCLSSLISSLTGAFVLWKLGSIDTGAAGLVLTYAATFTDNVMWFVQLYAMIQQNLNSVERIKEYTEVEQEVAQPLKPADNLPTQWPSRGAIRFQGYTTRYAPELEPVLKNIDLEVRPGERIAVVGRTGAGKSTLTLALIRGLEAEGGKITIDGVDIASVTLELLRQAVTVVPQDPTLFNGSLRDNLDPLQRYRDVEIHAALRTVHLFDSLPSQNLDHPVVALSLGQRQLLCIARALLRGSRVLVLDEATASIDHETDALIQKGLRASIAAGTTVLTIAHRLHTIADYDQVVVLDAGRVVEKGAVKELLRRRGSDALFRHLCEQSGSLDRIERAANGIP